jgi:hypothetical protein
MAMREAFTSGALLQVVDCARGVPDAVAHQVQADEQALVAQHAMLARPRSHAGTCFVAVPELHPLALAGGIVDQRKEPVARQQDAEALVGFRGLAFVGVAARHDHRRKLALGLFGR